MTKKEESQAKAAATFVSVIKVSLIWGLHETGQNTVIEFIVHELM